MQVVLLRLAPLVLMVLVRLQLGVSAMVVEASELLLPLVLALA